MKRAKPVTARDSRECASTSPPQKSPEDCDAHVCAWAQREFDAGRGGAWIPEALDAALRASDAGNPAPLARYVRDHGTTPIAAVRALVADMIEGRAAPTRLQARTAAILRALPALRQFHAKELRRVAVDSSYRPRFGSVRAVHEWLATEYLGSAEQWRTIEQLELRHKR